MTAEETKTTIKRLKITDYFRKVNHPLPETPSTSLAIKRSSERPGDNSANQSIIEKKTKANTPPIIDIDSIMTEGEESNNHWSFLKLTDVLTDDNLINDLSQADDTYVLYQQPWVKDEVPRPLREEDDFSNATNYVKMPFQNNITVEYRGERVNKWELIKRLLGSTKIRSVYELEKAIKAYNPIVDYLEFDILRSYIHYQMDSDDKEYFFDELLPAIIQLALDLPNIITCNLPILDQDSSTALFLSQRQISSLMANAFLCTYSQRFKDDRRSINFTRYFFLFVDSLVIFIFCIYRLYSTNRNEKKKSCKLEKIKCFLTYFRRVISSVPTGTVSFERKRLPASVRPDDSTKKLCRFAINSGQCMFKHGCDYSMVDFANKFLGGGVLNSGCVQEEILFVICPELIIGKLITERLMDTDAVLITGAEQFSEYTAYSDAFKWAGNYQDNLPRDRLGRRMRQTIAMDALYFSPKAISSQYEKEKIDRELYKAMSAFQGERFLRNRNNLPAVSTGNWGCGVYNGDPYLKTLIQIVAASEMGRDILYFAFNEEQLRKDYEEIGRLLEDQSQLTVAELYQMTLEFGDLKRQMPKLNLLRFLSSKLA